MEEEENNAPGFDGSGIVSELQTIQSMLADQSLMLDGYMKRTQQQEIQLSPETKLTVKYEIGLGEALISVLLTLLIFVHLLTWCFKLVQGRRGANV